MSEEIHPLVKLLCEDRRYKLEAYQFVRAGLSYAQDVLGMGMQNPGEDVAGELQSEPAPAAEAGLDEGEMEALHELGMEELDQDHPAEVTPGGRPLRHVTGQDLCRALRSFAIDQYGRMAKLVLKDVYKRQVK